MLQIRHPQVKVRSKQGWEELPACTSEEPVLSVNGRTGHVVLTDEEIYDNSFKEEYGENTAEVVSQKFFTEELDKKINDEEISKNSSFSSQKTAEIFSKEKEKKGERIVIINDSSSVGENLECNLDMKNHWYAGNQTFEHSTYRIQNWLTAGIYTISAEITNNSPNPTTAIMTFIDRTNTVIATIPLQIGGRTNNQVILDRIASHISLYSASSPEESRGITATWSNIQIERGPIATSYVPPLQEGLAGTVVHKYGKNLIDPFSIWNTTEDTSCYYKIESFSLKKNIPYTFSVPEINSESSLSFISYSNNQVLISVTNQTKLTYIPTENIEVFLQYVHKGLKDGVQNKVMLEIGNNSSDYCPYEGWETFGSPSDGIITGMTSLSPNMTIFTDKEGINISIKYKTSIPQLNLELSDRITALEKKEVVK